MTRGALPNFAENLAANALTARLTTSHDTLRGRHDGDTESTLHAADLILANVHTATRARDALQVADDRLVVRAVLQVYAQNALAAFLDWLVVGDVALFLEDAGDLRLKPRGWNVELLVTRTVCVANTGQKICYWIGQIHRLPFTPRSLLRLRRTCGNVLQPPQSIESANNVSPGTLRERAATLKVAEPVNARALPARLHNARDLALERQTTEAQTADAELAQERARTAAQLAPVVLTGLELRLAGVFYALCSSCHMSSLCSLAERHAEVLQQCACAIVVLGGSDDRHVHALRLVHLRVVDLREDELVAQTQRVVATPVEALRADAAEVAHTRQSHRDQAVEELVHRIAAQRHHRADGHALAQLERRNRLLRFRDDRLLPGNRPK